MSPSNQVFAAVVALLLLAALPAAHAQIGTKYSLSLSNGCSILNEIPLPTGWQVSTATCVFTATMTRPSLNSDSWTFAYQVSFGPLGGGGLSGAHIHTGGPTASGTVWVNFNNFGLAAGTKTVSALANSVTVTLTPAQVQGILDGNTYINIHSSNPAGSNPQGFPGGETRGQIAAARVLVGDCEFPSDCVTDPAQDSECWQCTSNTCAAVGYDLPLPAGAALQCSTAGTGAPLDGVCCIGNHKCIPPAEFGLRCDPIVTGFDGKEFHFNDAGDFTLLSEGDGWRVDVTFLGETVEEGGELKEASWTSSVRIFSPKGDMVEMRLPGIRPNTNKVQMTALPAGANDAVVLGPFSHSVEFDEMTATAVLSDEPEREVWACVVETPKMCITIKQMWGEKQALIDEAMESWARPFTWLNTDFQLRQPLAAPVTGILGATYPLDQVVQQGAGALRPESELALEAAVNGAHGGRQLASAEDGDGVFLSAGVVGLSPPTA